jgi:hypothetical protein
LRATTRMAASQMLCFRNSSTTFSFVRKRPHRTA